jgi:hypothetical protein
MDDDVDKKDFASNNDLCLFNAADSMFDYFSLLAKWPIPPFSFGSLSRVCVDQRKLCGEKRKRAIAPSIKPKI